ncbi:MAG: MinD/ParA family protein [Anaerolineae bacterium]|nr:MinD/ParA family protein [Anaerolineae bacterium]
MAELIKVLLVDDVPETRENLKKLLAFEPDIEVVGAASTGREALQFAEEVQPDIVLMDINMPDMDGITATERMKSVAPAAAVVMMSVQSEADYLRRAMMAGARDFLTKPISGDDLYSTIRRVFDMTLEDRARARESNNKVGGSGAAAKPGGAGRKGYVVGVFSPQGGAGVTTLATNMATAIMTEGIRVLLIDSDLQFGDVGVFLNLQAKHNLADLASSLSDIDEDYVENVTATHPSGLKVLLAPPSPEDAEKVVGRDVVSLVETLRRYYDYIIIDMSNRLDDMNVGLMDLADLIVLLATPTLPSIKNIRIMLDLFRALKYEDEKIIFVMNRVNPEKAGRAYIPIEAIEKNLNRRVDVRIPLDDRTFLSAVNQGVSVIAKDTRQSPARELIELAELVKRTFSGVELEEPTVSDARNESLLGNIFKRQR